MTEPGPQFANYRIAHRPPADGYGLHEAEQVYPDIHEHPEFYTSTWAKPGSTEHRQDRQSMSTIRAARGKPDTTVMMHRAVPHGVREIHTGDWVTTSHAYAKQHLDGPMDGQGRVISAPAKARHLHPSGDFIHEHGYSGPTVAT